ncbi:MAG: dTMP kinase [Lawsonibacter sp.]|jgi:dTMP kinase|nr:dTMP kinase [Lawsonibacter sp.]
MKGQFFALEGIDGSGKTTQLKLLARRLEEAGVPCLTTCEPTSGPIGKLLRQVLTGQVACDSRVVAPLFAADRLDHLLNGEGGLCRAVESGLTVLTDRYYFSSYAYQSVDFPLEWVVEVNRPSAQLLRPTATIFIDVSPELALERIAQNRERAELFETRDRLTRTREQYFKAFQLEKDRERVIIIPGDRAAEAVAGEIWAAVSTLLSPGA